MTAARVGGKGESDPIARVVQGEGAAARTGIVKASS